MHVSGMRVLVALGILLAAPGFAAAPVEVHVSTYGALPNDAKDDGLAIQKAINFAKANPTVRKIRFAAGQYDIKPQFSDFHLKIAGFTDISLLGARSGSTAISDPLTKLMFYDVTKGGISFLENKNSPSIPKGRAVEFNGFIVDYQPLTFAQTTIESVNGNKITVRQNKGLPLSHPAFFSANQPWAFVAWRNSVSANYIRGVAKFVPKTRWIRSLGSGRYELTASEIQANSFIRKGNPFIVLARDYRASALRIKSNAGGVIVKNVTILSSAGVATEWGKNEGWRHAINLRTRPRDSSFFLSTAGDVIHSYGNRGSMLIEGCSFDGMSDDAINLHGRGVHLGAKVIDRTGKTFFHGTRIDSHTLGLMDVGTNDYRAGDILVLADKDTGAKVQEMGVSSAAFDTASRTYTVHLSAPLNAAAQSQFNSLILFNSSASSGSTTVRGNEFKAFRGRAVVVQTSHVRIENNIAKNLIYNFAVIHTSMLWKEGPFPKHIKISGNNITSIDPSINGTNTPLIISSIENADGSHSTAKEISGIYISDNILNNKKGQDVLLLNIKPTP